MQLGLDCLPLMKPDADFRCGLATAATPNVVGKHTLHISCNSIIYWHGVARIKHRGLAVGDSRKDAHAGTLPDVYLKEDFLED